MAKHGIRLISGHYGGRKLMAPEDGATIRPTKSVVREAAFNMLTSRVHWPDCRVLDLCCGTGALGLEALSRGAAHVAFVDRDTTWVQKNTALLNLSPDQVSVTRADIAHYTPKAPAQVILADPPYSSPLWADILARKETLGEPESFWLFEVPTGTGIDYAAAGFTLIKEKKYGKSTLLLLQQV